MGLSGEEKYCVCPESVGDFGTDIGGEPLGVIVPELGDVL